MVDVSTLFIVFEFFKQFASFQLFVNSPQFAIFLLAAAVLLLVAALLIPKQPDTAKVSARGVVRFLSGCFFVLALLAYLTLDSNVLYTFVYNVWGLAKMQFLGDAAYSLLAAAGLVFFVASRFMTKEPDNESRMNRRQQFSVISFFCVAGFVVATLYHFWPSPTQSGIVLVLVVLEVINIFFWFYDPIIYIISKFIRIRPKPAVAPTPGRLNSFAVIGCAHNEETVIANLIKSLYKTTYPRDKYDLYVICDNCTDQTAEMVRKAGAIAMERFDEERRGKGFALEWMFDILHNKALHGQQQYDAYIILDADNVVNEEFLDEINENLNLGYEIMQAYLGCKNPRDTWVSKCYSMAYWLSNANFQHAHSRLGLSAQMGGTGMVLRPSVLEDIGWETGSLTEDLILTSKYVLAKNRPCCWVHNARLYDEKPLQLKPSIKQRTRWMQGHMDGMMRYAPKEFLNGLRNLSLKQMDIGFYLCRPMLNLLMLVCYIVRFTAVIFFPESFLAISYLMNLQTALLLTVSYFLMQFFVLNEENFLRFGIWIPLQWIFTYTWYPPIFRGFVKRNEKYWVSTVHARSIDITEVREDAEVVEARRLLEGLENMHRMPIGQILLKATVITREQLDTALEYQREHGGFLGDVIVKLGYISQKALAAYLGIQQESKEAAKGGDGASHRMQIGEMLMQAGLISQSQLNIALDYQEKNDARIGESLVATGAIDQGMLNAFLRIKTVLDANNVRSEKTQDLIRGSIDSQSRIGDLLLDCGLVTRQQLAVATKEQNQNGGLLGDILANLGYVDKDVVDIALLMQQFGRQATAEAQMAHVGV